MSGSSVPAETPSTPPITARTSTSLRSFVFSRIVRVFMTPEQDEWLAQEVVRRRRRGQTSEIPAAHGGNRNVNKGTLIREAIETHFKITPDEREV